MNEHKVRRWTVAALAAAGVLGALAVANALWPVPWSRAELEQLRTLWLGSLVAPSPDPSNRFADDPAAAKLGARLFRDARLSRSGKIACSTCHDPKRAFTDGLPVAEGQQRGRRNTPSVAPAAHGSWYFWDGRRDSQWAQALTPLENDTEQGGRRTDIARVIADHYRADYEAIFGPLPALPRERFPAGASPLGSDAEKRAWHDMTPADRTTINRIFVGVGKSLAAYQRRLRLRPSRFDRYVEALLKNHHYTASRLLSEEELSGLRLFIGRANCVNCHRGPLFTSFEFFSLGLPKAGAEPDAGRGHAFAAVQGDPFNCLGRYSDAKPADCAELRFMAHDSLGFFANFKTPSLRNVAVTAPYMHSGQFTKLEQVVLHYSEAPRVPFPEHTDIQPLGLSAPEQTAIVAFLGTLTSELEDPFAEP